MIALGVPSREVAGLLPVAGVLVAAAGVVFAVARERVKDAGGIRFDRAQETKQLAVLRSAGRTAVAAVVLAVAAALVLLPEVVSVVHAAMEPPRRYSAVKAALLLVEAVLAVVAVLAESERRKAARAAAAWRFERDAVVSS